MKICRDCFYYKKSWTSPFSDTFANCKFLSGKEQLRVDLVTGKLITKVVKFCSTERLFSCGEEGKNFWPRRIIDPGL